MPRESPPFWRRLLAGPDPAIEARAASLYRPLTVLLAGLLAVFLAWLAAGFADNYDPLKNDNPLIPLPVTLIVLFSGTLLTAVGAGMRLARAAWDLPQRIETAALISLVGLASLLGYLAMNQDWDSGKMFYAALFIACLAGVVLILLPPLPRRIALSLFILYHFGGMVVAITSVDPPGSQGLWVSRQLWVRAYRPYLQFMYLTNAYHFYSPDPGPPALLWFALQYDDGTYSWVKLPDRENSPISMHYQRMLALPEHSYQPKPRLPLMHIEILEARKRKLLRPEEEEEIAQRGSWEDIFQRRNAGSTFRYKVANQPDWSDRKTLPIPLVQDFDISVQHREPTWNHKKTIASVAKRILWTAPPREDGKRAKTVKMYRLIHRILSPDELSQGVRPLAKWKHLPYFLGEFDREGKLVDPLDPFLYWYLPIAKVHPDYGQPGEGAPTIFVNYPWEKGQSWRLLDSLELHAAGRNMPEKAKRDLPQENKK
jgi:hypothetical protein